jgi:Cu+-exporting ATPase
LLNLPPNDPTESKEVDSQVLAADDESRQRVELRIGGMTCGACVAAIEGQISGLDGILSVQVSLLAERAVIEYDPNYVDAKGEGWT